MVQCSGVGFVLLRRSAKEGGEQVTAAAPARFVITSDQERGWRVPRSPRRSAWAGGTGSMERWTDCMRREYGRVVQRGS